MTFQPYPTNSGVIALSVTATSGLSAIIAISQLSYQESLLGMFVAIIITLLALLVMLWSLSWAVMAFRLHYRINRNGVVIDWGFARQLIPLRAIQRVIPAHTGTQLPRFRGLNLAGLRLGRGYAAEYGPVSFFSTAAPAESLLLVTEAGTYCISPRNAAEFIHAWESRLTIKPTQHWTTQLVRRWPFNQPMLFDRWAWGFITVGVLLCVGLFGYIAVTFTTLPTTVSMQLGFNETISYQTDKPTLFLFPLIGTVLLLFNILLGALAYLQDRVAAYFAWGSAVVVQIGLVVTVYSIVSGMTG